MNNKEFDKDDPDQCKLDWDDPQVMQDTSEQRDPANAEANLPQREPVIVSETPQQEQTMPQDIRDDTQSPMLPSTKPPEAFKTESCQFT